MAEHPALKGKGGQARTNPVAGAARAGSERSDDSDDRPLWATVNICDTKKSPNALGVRTSVPGNGSNQRIFARYTAQWWSAAQEEWLTVAGSGVTDWVFVGDADMSSRQAGWTFRFVQPAQGTTYVMRGVVELQWREAAQTARKARKARNARRARRGRRAQRRQHAARGRRFRLDEGRSRSAGVVRERTLLTETGVKGVQGGDPAGLSKAMCLIW